MKNKISVTSPLILLYNQGTYISLKPLKHKININILRSGHDADIYNTSMLNLNHLYVSK